MYAVFSFICSGLLKPGCSNLQFWGYSFGIGLFWIQVWDWVIGDIGFVFFIRSFINTLVGLFQRIQGHFLTSESTELKKSSKAESSNKLENA